MWNHEDTRGKHRRRTREKRIKIWTLKKEKVTEYRDKMEEEFQLEADTNAEEGWNLFKSLWWQQKRYMEPPKEGNTWRGRPGGGMERCRRA